MPTARTLPLLLTLCALSLAACSGGDGGTDPLEIAGSWVDDWGFSHVITDSSWTNDPAVFHISQYDNDAGFLTAQNDAANEYSPDLWSRFDWTWDGAALYYCQIAYDAATEQAALANESADPGDLETGCNGFAWSKLTPQ